MLSGVKKTVCCPLNAFMSTRNQSVLKDRLNAERTTSVKNKPLPMVTNSNIPHQLRVNWYSTRVSLNCSKVSQGILGILTILNSCLAASFMNKSKPMLFWETSCSMFCERFQQYWPYRVPMNCGVKLSFILIIMTHHSCNHFGDLYWLNSSIRIIDRNNLPLSLFRRNGSLREKGRLAGRKAESSHQCPCC